MDIGKSLCGLSYTFIQVLYWQLEGRVELPFISITQRAEVGSRLETCPVVSECSVHVQCSPMVRCS